eukprot:3421876-Rhodomonas_salina.1
MPVLSHGDAHLLVLTTRLVRRLVEERLHHHSAHSQIARHFRSSSAAPNIHLAERRSVMRKNAEKGLLEARAVLLQIGEGAVAYGAVASRGVAGEGVGRADLERLTSELLRRSALNIPPVPQPYAGEVARNKTDCWLSSRTMRTRS